MIDYRVRSVSLLNLVNDIKSERLIPDAYFQRNLVWREIHKRDFIQTILKGYPFPQIFISKGKIDVESMSTKSCIVDGQQRCDAINTFIKGEFEVDGKYYNDLADQAKSDFLKYEIAVIELDLENNDPKVQEIFQRINRTSNSLTSIEKLASQYSTSEYMLTAKLLSDQIDLTRDQEDDLREDPNIPDEFFVWARKKSVKNYSKLVNSKGVFSSYEIARKANLMHTLNLMTTLSSGFFNRNEKSIDQLETYPLSYPDKDIAIAALDRAADYILKMGFKGKSYWLNKANVFSLLIAIDDIASRGLLIDIGSCKTALELFEANLPEAYKLAATEAVNSTRSRQLRHVHLSEVLLSAIT
jgi:hypothetical protein